MESSLVITDLRTAPERTWIVEDRLSRARVQIQIGTDPIVEFDHHASARAMTAFISVLSGLSFDDIHLEKVRQPFGVSSQQLVTRYRLRIGQDPVVGLISLIASFDEALDGDAPCWRAHECSMAEALQFGGALELHLNLHRPQ